MRGIYLLCLLFAYSNALLNVSNTITSNMVLQRAPLQANIWGWADANATVIVTINGTNYRAIANETGEYSVLLPPTEAGGPYVISVTSALTGEKLILQNILFGDVWVCSGQSNMQFTVDMGFNSSYEIGLASSYPNIRVFTVGTEHVSTTPYTNLYRVLQNWSIPDKDSIGGGNWSYMSAVCWFFGRDLYDQYKVPIGLISTNWGGTYIQAWSSPEVLKKCNVTEAPSPIAAHPNQPSVLWNSMIYPFLPQSIRGVIWYQGESNVNNPPLYTCVQPAMIQDWRSNWASGWEFPFLFVQLAPWTGGDYNYSVQVGQLRDAQLVALNLPAVGYASAVDLGDYLSPFGSIHPRNKQEVGRRLVLAARNIAYGEKDVVWEGPTFASATQSVSNKQANVQVTFTSYGEKGLYYRSAVCPPTANNNTCYGWEILLSDGTWYPATSIAMSSIPNLVEVGVGMTSDLTVKGIRYAYHIWPLATLFSPENLPAVPFSYLF